jgi:hypothetical protein
MSHRYERRCPRRSGRPRRPVRAAWLVVVFAVCGVAAVWHVTGHTVVSLEKLAAFQETAPFQYRLLVPAMVRVAHDTSGWPPFRLFVVAEWAGWVLLVFGAGRHSPLFRPD